MSRLWLTLGKIMDVLGRTLCENERTPGGRTRDADGLALAYRQQNSLAAALREVGRIERTLFTLRWFKNPLRQLVTTELNKSEARNSLDLPRKSGEWTCPGKVESSLEVKGELDDEAEAIYEGV